MFGVLVRHQRRLHARHSQAPGGSIKRALHLLVRRTKRLLADGASECTLKRTACAVAQHISHRLTEMQYRLQPVAERYTLTSHAQDNTGGERVRTLIAARSAGVCSGALTFLGPPIISPNVSNMSR
jgi:hypothetical protein